jgi:hypothetical protein
MQTVPVFHRLQRVLTEYGAGFVIEIRPTELDPGKSVYFVQHDFGGPASGFYAHQLRAEPTV